MICDVCHSAERTDQLVRYSISLGDRFVIVDHVPAIVCPHCGETSYRPEVVDAVQRTIAAQGAPARVIETPVYEFAL